MALNNYRELSVAGSIDNVGAGFQWEFRCGCCGARWTSPFKPYRSGQLAAIVGRFASLFGNMGNAGRASFTLSEMGKHGARESAFADAMAQAGQRFVECAHCHEGVCLDCHDDRKGMCRNCLERSASRDSGGGGGGGGGNRASAASCPSCGTPGDGGRFCAECGFDMASTHKSCPGCGTLVARNVRYCTDCGHAF